MVFAENSCIPQEEIAFTCNSISCQDSHIKKEELISHYITCIIKICELSQQSHPKTNKSELHVYHVLSKRTTKNTTNQHQNIQCLKQSVKNNFKLQPDQN